MTGKQLMSAITVHATEFPCLNKTKEVSSSLSSGASGEKGLKKREEPLLQKEAGNQGLAVISAKG